MSGLTFPTEQRQNKDQEHAHSTGAGAHVGVQVDAAWSCAGLTMRTSENREGMGCTQPTQRSQEMREPYPEREVAIP